MTLSHLPKKPEESLFGVMHTQHPANCAVLLPAPSFVHVFIVTLFKGGSFCSLHCLPFGLLIDLRLPWYPRESARVRVHVIRKEEKKGGREEKNQGRKRGRK